MLSHANNIIIDRTVVAPSYGRYVFKRMNGTKTLSINVNIKKFFNMKQGKAIPIHPICITDKDRDYIIDEIIFQEKLSLRDR